MQKRYDLVVVGAGSAEMKLSELASTIHVYPTFGSGLQQAASTATVSRITSGLKGKLMQAMAR